MGKKRVVVIGSGFSGLSAATHLAQASNEFSVKILEKNESPGGRARKFERDGFVYDMGPSWYWMPDVFEKYFANFGKKPGDYYDLMRLEPSYSVVYGKNDVLDIPSKLDDFSKMLEQLEPGAAQRLDDFLQDAQFKYELAMKEFVYKPGLSLLEFASTELLSSLRRVNILESMSKHLRNYFKNDKILRLMEFPVIFLGETADNIPSLYSLMNYADIALGTWYPKGGMHEIVRAMVCLAEDKGVEILCSSEVERIAVDEGLVKAVELTNGEKIEADVVIASADYHHVDDCLLDPMYRNYEEEYWDSRTMAPSSLIFYLGISKRLKNLRHHNLFFDEPLGPHADAIYESPRWPEKPLFYVSVPSVSDPSVAPPGMENLFVLIPLAVGLKDSEEIREYYYDVVMRRMEDITDQDIRSYVCYKRSYCLDDFKADYHAYKGNAYGLANTLLQTAIFKPKIKNDRAKNLYYTGQLTVPGPGVPPCLISGEIVARQVMKDIESNARHGSLG